MTKEEKLRHIADEIARCFECKKDATGLPVAGEGSAYAKVVFVGEAPGRQEAATGRPFVGRSGKLLRSLITEIGLKDEDIFITSVGKYLPLHGAPTSGQISQGRKYLLEQLNIIHPQVVVLLGVVAIQGVFREKISVMKVHGTLRHWNDSLYFFTLHPAAALRFLPMRKELESDFQKLEQLVTGIL